MTQTKSDNWKELAVLQRAVNDPAVRAAFRKLKPESPSPTFYRIMTPILDKNGSPESGQDRCDQEYRWAVIASVIAQAHGYLGNTKFGTAAASGKITEVRMSRLLQSHGDALYNIIRTIVQQLVSKGQMFNIHDVAELILFDGTKEDDFRKKESPRRRLARQFYQEQKET